MRACRLAKKLLSNDCFATALVGSDAINLPVIVSVFLASLLFALSYFH